MFVTLYKLEPFERAPCPVDTTGHSFNSIPKCRIMIPYYSQTVAFKIDHLSVTVSAPKGLLENVEKVIYADKLMSKDLEVSRELLSPEITEFGEKFTFVFLFLEPTEGQPRLDMVYNVIDLDTQQIRSNILHPVSLVQLDFLHEGPHREMLSVYNSLQKNLVENCSLQKLLNSVKNSPLMLIVPI